MRKLKLDELGRLSRSEFKEIEKIPVTIVLDNIRSGMNVGSFFRTADAYKIERIILCGITAQPPHKEILKTAIGASQTVEWSYDADVESAVDQLKTEDYHIVGIEQTDRSIELNNYEVHRDKKYAIVFGNEVNGISESILPKIDDCIELAQYGTKHSLNVSVCGGIVIWYFGRVFL